MEAQLQQFIEQLFVMVKDLTNVAYVVPLLTLVVSLIKRIQWFEGVEANTIHLVLQVVFWAGYAVVNHFGHGEQLQQWTEALTIIVQTLLPLIVSFLGGKALYERAKKAEAPLWGYSRS